MITKIFSAKVAAAAVAAVLSAGSAAATGNLPSVASDALETIGVPVPGPNSHSEGHADGRGKSGDHAPDAADDEGDDAADDAEAPTPSTGPNVHATFGLCTAKAASDGHPDSHADVFPSDAVCAAVTHPGHGDETHGKPADPGSEAKSHKPESASDEDAADEDAADDDAADHGNSTPAEHNGGAGVAGGRSAGAENRSNHGRP